MIHLIQAAFSRPRTVLLTLAVILLAGASAYKNIPKESDPDIDIPTIYVSMSHEGISPEDAERLLVKPMEQELRSIEGIKEMKAIAGQGHASVTLEFEAGFDADKAMDDVRNKVDQAKAELPAETKEPTVHEVNVALFPVLVVNLYGNVAEAVLVKIAGELQDALEALPGVLEVEIGGDRDEMIEINVDPLLMESHGLSINDMASFVNRNNQLIAAGTLQNGSGRYPLKVPGVIDDIEDLLTLPIKRDANRVLTLQDVSSVKRTFRDANSFARLNGQPTLSLEITKRIGANVIDTIDQVRQIVTAAQEQLPSNVQVSYSQDKSEDIRNMLSDLQNNVISGIVLVMIIIIGALGLRAGLLVGVSIPGAFLLGILIISAMGLTVNIVVLFSLILALGLLVDGAIVVVELADRNLADGMSKREAYQQAATRMAWPIIASTATTLAAFAPLLLWPGVMGEFMRYLPITLIAVLSSSLLMALVFVPNLGNAIGSNRAGSKLKTWQPGMAEKGFTGVYLKVLRTLIRHTGKVLILGFISLIGVYVLYGVAGEGMEFFPEIEPENAVIQIAARGDLSAQAQDELVRQVETRILPMQADFVSIYARSGSSWRADVSEDTIGLIQLELQDWQTRRPAETVLNEVRERLADLSGLAIEVRKQKNGPNQGKPIKLQLSGPDINILSQAIDQIKSAMNDVGGFIDIEDNRPNAGIEWQLDVDRAEASRFGTDIALVGRAVQMLTSGIKVAEYRPDDTDDELDVRVRFPAQHRNFDQLNRLRIQTSNGNVPISQFVTRQPAPKISAIQRSDGSRAYTLQADVTEGLLVDEQLKALKSQLAGVKFDPRIRLKIKGEGEEMAESQAFLSNAFLVALALIAAILLTQFNSFYQSFLVLTAVIFSTVGVLLGLLIAGEPFGVVMSGIGVIALAGIVVNNNIVLIDTYNYLRNRGVEPFEAVLETGAQRLRPVLLTTATTILGLMPMVLQMNVDIINRDITFGAPSTQWWVQLATAVVGGLAFSTLLTLVLTPCMLALGIRASNWRARRKMTLVEIHQASTPHD